MIDFQYFGVRIVNFVNNNLILNTYKFHFFKLASKTVWLRPRICIPIQITDFELYHIVHN